jgi:hypothetical protein
LGWNQRIIITVVAMTVASFLAVKAVTIVTAVVATALLTMVLPHRDNSPG